MTGTKSKYCDPFVKIFIGNEEVYATETKQNVKNWVSYDETYFSNKISKKSEIKIKVLDEEVGLFAKNKTMYEESMNIEKLVESDLIIGPHSKLYVNAIWKDEYENDN